MKLGLFLGLPLAFFLAGCTATYGPRSYSEEQLSPRTYRILFTYSNQWGGGAGRSVEDFTLLRSAELTLEKRCEYFVILSREYQQRHIDHGDKTFDVMADAAYTVRMFRGEPTADELVAYDAAFVQRVLRREYELGTAPRLPSRVQGDCGT